MSDYLNNLVARTLNLAPVVQPRLPSFFEHSASRVSAPLESDTLSEDSSSPQQASRISSGAPSPMQSAIPQPQEMLEMKAAAPAQKSADDSESYHDREQSANALLQPLSTAPVVRPLHYRPGSLSAAPQPVPLRIALSTPREAKAPEAQAYAAAVATNERDHHDSLPTLEHKVRIVGDKSAHVPPPPSNNREAIESISARSNHSGIAQHTELPQTISVTIGRVDVRAIFPQPLTQRVSHARPPAPMSLDEYLKRRSEGRR